MGRGGGGVGGRGGHKNELVSDTNSKIENVGLCIAGQGEGRVGKSRYCGHLAQGTHCIWIRTRLRTLVYPKYSAGKPEVMETKRTSG